MAKSPVHELLAIKPEGANIHSEERENKVDYQAWISAGNHEFNDRGGNGRHEHYYYNDKREKDEKKISHNVGVYPHLFLNQAG